MAAAYFYTRVNVPQRVEYLSGTNQGSEGSIKYGIMTMLKDDPYHGCCWWGGGGGGEGGVLLYTYSQINVLNVRKIELLNNHDTKTYDLLILAPKRQKS